MSVWFTSDWHFGHRNILTLGEGRPWATIEEHDQALVDSHNSLVSPDDVVFVLGDVAMGDINISLQRCAAMLGRKYLLCGNHDRPTMCPEVKRQDWIDRYKVDGGFVDVQTVNQFPITLLDGYTVIASHYPFAGESVEGRPDRFTDRRPIDDLEHWLVHGHVHRSWKVNGRQINVGVDVWDYQPVPAMVIREICAGDLEVTPR